MFASGCATTAKAIDFMPLAVGNRWTYRVTPGPTQAQEVVILKRDSDGFFVDNQGGRLAPRRDGIFDGTRFLLEEPLVVDHSWSAVPGNASAERYRIIANDAEVTVEAGTFAPCVIVQGEQPTRDPNTGKAATLIMTWTYARGVGLVEMQQAVRLSPDIVQTTATIELLSFAPAQAATAR